MFDKTYEDVKYFRQKTAKKLSNKQGKK